MEATGWAMAARNQSPSVGLGSDDRILLVQGVTLHDRQVRALDHVASVAAAGPPVPPHLRVTTNFHPDRLSRDDVPVLEAMTASGRLLSQFVTGTSAGGLTAHPGGDRWRWECRLFGGAYDDADDDLRPLYGALDRFDRGYGGAVRFGSAHLRFTAEVTTRCTFCFPDSVCEPELFGVAGSLAMTDMDGSAADLLDDYIEAHVHGPVRFDRDVEAIVLDPSHRGTEVEEGAGGLGCAVEWHPGLVLEVSTLRRHPNYRGRESVALGCALAQDDVLTPRLLGAAARTGRYDEQSLKKVWHHLASFGRPAGSDR